MLELETGRLQLYLARRSGRQHYRNLEVEVKMNPSVRLPDLNVRYLLRFPQNHHRCWDAYWRQLPTPSSALESARL